MTPQEQLCEKMRQEQNKYYDWLTAQPPEEILRHAYEYSVREDIILATEEMNLTPAQVRELLKSPAPLADVYKDFSKLETDYMSIVAQCVEDRADDLLKKEQQQNPPKVYRQSITYADYRELPRQHRRQNSYGVRAGAVGGNRRLRIRPWLLHLYLSAGPRGLADCSRDWPRNFR